MIVQPYLDFEGRCEEALDFYRNAIGAEVTLLLRFKDGPEPCTPGDAAAGIENKIMHASVRIGSSTLMASDCNATGQPRFEGFSLSLTVPNEAAAERAFEALGDGGQVKQPLIKTFFSPKFGVVSDRFGVSWMIYVAP